MDILLVTAEGPYSHGLKAWLNDLDRSAKVVMVEPAESSLLSRGTAHTPKLAIVDMDAMGERGALVAMSDFRDHHPSVPMVALSDQTNETMMQRARDAGARWYIPKTYSESKMKGALRLALELTDYEARTPVLMPASHNESATSGQTLNEHQFGLTPRELQVLAAAICGNSSWGIAKRLGISEGTVKIHFNNIFRKTGAPNRVAACLLGQRLPGVQNILQDQARKGESMIDWLLSHMRAERHKQGEILFRKGASGRALFYIQRGAIQLEEIAVEMREGTLFGEIALFAPHHTRTCTARCHTDVDLFSLDVEQVHRLCYEQPQFSTHLTQLITHRLTADLARNS